jgi:zinc protease
VRQWPARVDAVTAEDVKQACRQWLEPRRAVTGFLLPQEPLLHQEPVQAA